MTEERERPPSDPNLLPKESFYKPEENPTHLTPTHEKFVKFLATYSHIGVIHRAAEMVGLNYNLVSKERKRNPAFEEKFLLARKIAADRVEAEVQRRAVEGFQEPVIYQGQHMKDEDGNPMYITKYSDRMLELLAKAVKPEKFRERYEVTGKDGGPLQLNVLEFKMPTPNPPHHIDVEPTNQDSDTEDA